MYSSRMKAESIVCAYSGMVSICVEGNRVKNEDKVLYIFQEWKQNLLLILIVSR